MAKEPIRHGQGPQGGGTPGPQTSGSVGMNLSPQQMWEQMCHVQSDMRKMTNMTRDMLDVAKKTLEEMQLMRSDTNKLLDEIKDVNTGIKDLNGKTTDLLDKTNSLMDATTELAEESKIASEQVTAAARDNRRAALAVEESVERLTLRNEQNIKQMSGDAEVLAQAAAITAVAQAENKSYDDAKKKVDEQLAESVKLGQDLKLWVKAVNDREIDERVTQKFAEKRKELED